MGAHTAAFLHHRFFTVRFGQLYRFRSVAEKLLDMVPMVRPSTRHNFTDKFGGVLCLLLTLG